MNNKYDDRHSDRDQRWQAKYSRRYGNSDSTPPNPPDVPMPPNPPSVNINIGGKDEYEKLPVDQRPDTRIEPGMSENEINERIRRRIAIREKQRNEFVTHLVSYIAVNAMLWIIFGVSRGGFPWPIFVTLGWGIGLFAHATQVYQNSAAVSAKRERTVQREIEMEKARLGLSGYDYEKPKRVYRDSFQPEPVGNTSDPGLASQASTRRPPSQQVRLSDDGELVPIDVNDQINTGGGNRPGQLTQAENGRNE